MTLASPVQQRWSLDSIDWRAIRSEAVAEPETLFYLVAAASFMEITTDRYTRNLIDQFFGDDEITSWLEQHWLPEEIQHGHALRRYVQIAWPDFAWERVYGSFLEEFSAYCSADVLEPTRTREMASRCVVEMGTASYYTTLSRISRDPVLATIAHRIAEDEIRHYKHFYRYFCRYQNAEPASRRAVFSALLNRLRMIDGEDSNIAMKHLYGARHPDKPLDDRIYRNLRRNSRQLIRPHFPHRMCVQMLLKPLGLGPRAHRIAVPVTEALARWIVP
jgi:ferritin-like protein